MLRDVWPKKLIVNTSFKETNSSCVLSGINLSGFTRHFIAD